MKEKTTSTRNFISLLMDCSDLTAKVRREFDGIVAARRPLSSEEHEAIKALMLGIASDINMADVTRFGAYERVTKEVFAVNRDERHSVC